MHYTFYLFFMFFSFLCFLNICTFKYLFVLICVFYFVFCILSLTFFDLSYSIIVNNKKKSIDFFKIFVFAKLWVFCCPNFECFVVQILSILLCRFCAFCCADFESLHYVSIKQIFLLKLVAQLLVFRGFLLLQSLLR